MKQCWVRFFNKFVIHSSIQMNNGAWKKVSTMEIWTHDLSLGRESPALPTRLRVTTNIKKFVCYKFESEI